LDNISVGIVSGKGGVGKTTLTASLASLASNDEDFTPIILDCDVDAPNLSIILPPDSNVEPQTEETYTTIKATFIPDKCVHCKKCIDDHYCEFNALTWDNENKIPIIDYLKCEGCGACKTLCPEHTFEIHPVKSGEIISYDNKYGSLLIFGKTILGSTTSGKLVSEVKDFAKHSDNYKNANLTIVDGPPGIGCPVIAMLSGLNYVIAITEPTPSGLHDLIRILELVDQFKIPFSIVVNKADLKSPFQKKFKKYIKNTNYKILGKIDFDYAIPEAMSYAEPVVDYAPHSKASISIKEIYKNLKKELNNF
jgi:MinD superfamily P-loop ATPase